MFIIRREFIVCAAYGIYHAESIRKFVKLLIYTLSLKAQNIVLYVKLQIISKYFLDIKLFQKMQ
jgi:hypothetical protein